MLIALFIEQFSASKEIVYHTIELIFVVQTTLMGSQTSLQEKRTKIVLLLKCMLSLV